MKSTNSSIVLRSSLARVAEAASVLDEDLVPVLGPLDGIAVLAVDHPATEPAYGKRAFIYTESRL